MVMNYTETRGWTSGPDGRGTFSIISTCILTMILCVWSALHLNVPPLNERWFANVWRMARWILLGIFGPELVLFAAWRQYNSAKTLVAQVNETHTQRGESFKTEKVKGEGKQTVDELRLARSISGYDGWKMIHGHYASMGGFVFDFSGQKMSKTFLVEHPYLTITPRGVALLAQLNLLPQLSDEEIKDKSKADGLAKAIVILQALWMFIQTIARGAEGQFVTLLEINTIAHIVCALIIFVFWWSKPRNVTQPTRIHAESIQPLVAFMYMSSKISGEEPTSFWYRLRQMRDPEFKNLVVTPVQDAEDGDSNDQSSAGLDKSPKYTFAPLPNPASGASTKNSDAEAPSTTHSTEFQKQRYALAAQALEIYPELQSRLTPLLPKKLKLSRRKTANVKEAPTTTTEISEITAPTQLQVSLEQLCIPAMGNWPTSTLCSGLSGTIMGCILWFTSMCYGAIHAAAWNDFFPTLAEKWLWRSSALWLTGSGALWFMINALGTLFKSFNSFWDRVMAARAGVAIQVVIGILCVICGAAYGFARVFLVVEAFISLRKLPVSAFDTPEWTNLVPHL